jgi:hypothetical protein
MSERLWPIEPGRSIGGITLGWARQAVLSRLEEEGVPVDSTGEDAEDPTYAEVEDGDISMSFDEEEPHTLIQIEILSEQAVLEGRPLLGRRIDEVVDQLRAVADETRWRNDYRHVDAPLAPDDHPLEPDTDERLLSSGTLWVTSCGVGLEVERGKVSMVLLRQPQHVPQRGLGPLTPAQRELLQQPDLDRRLSPAQVAVQRPVSAPRSLLRGGLTAALFIAVGVLVWQAHQFQVRWNNAPTAEATVIAVKPPPPDPFPEEFTVAYADKAGNTHHAILRQADVYVLREVGDKVTLSYLPEAPHRPLGPARIRDAAFLVYMPYGIAIGAVYCVLLILSGLVAAVISGQSHAGEASSAD